MKPRHRQAQIAELVSQQGKASVDVLAALYRVSAETIRRDLSELAGAGLVEKVHGGARRSRLLVEGSFQERMGENAAAKEEIARKLASLIDDGDTIFIDTGSTTLACAHRLASKARLTVITNSARVAQALAAGDGQSHIYLVGGEYRADNAQTVGPVAIEQIRSFQADRAVITVTALDGAAGATDSLIEEAQIARAMIACSNQLILLADSAKLDRQAAFRVCTLEDVDILVTDRRPSPELRVRLHQAEVELI